MLFLIGTVLCPDCSRYVRSISYLVTTKTPKNYKFPVNIETVWWDPSDSLSQAAVIFRLLLILIHPFKVPGDKSRHNPMSSIYYMPTIDKWGVHVQFEYLFFFQLLIIFFLESSLNVMEIGDERNVYTFSLMNLCNGSTSYSIFKGW